MQGITTLLVEGPDLKACADLHQHLKPSLEYLEVSGVNDGLEVLLRSLQDSPNQRTLDIDFESLSSKCVFWWPRVSARNGTLRAGANRGELLLGLPLILCTLFQGMVLPQLRCVKLSCESYAKPDTSLLKTLRCMLRAHR